MADSSNWATSRSGTTAGPGGGFGFELGGGAGSSVSAGIAADPSEAVYWRTLQRVTQASAFKRAT